MVGERDTVTYDLKQSYKIVCQGSISISAQVIIFKPLFLMLIKKN